MTEVAFKDPCRAATTANITLSGLSAIDGVSLTGGDRVLVKNQSTASANGIYLASSGAWTRSPDFDGAGEVVGGTMVFVTAGTLNLNSLWRLDGAGSVTIGTTPLSFVSGIPSGSVSFLQSGTAAAPRTVQSKLREYALSVKDFGALGDGVADDTAAMQAALTACGTANVALFIPGTSAFYRITSDLTLPAGVRIYGDGYKSAVKQVTLNENAFVVGDNCVVEGISVQGPGGTASIGGSGFYCQNAENFTIRNCRASYWPLAGIEVRECLNFQLRGNLFFGSGCYAFPSTGVTASSDIIVISNAPGGKAIIEGNLCLSDNSEGIFVNANGHDGEIVIANNVCVALDPTTWSELANNNGLGGTGYLNRRHGILAGYTPSGGGRMVIIGNICRNTMTSGIYCSNHSATTGTNYDMVITGNHCSKNGYGRGSDETVSGGIMLNGGGPAGCIVADNIVRDYNGSLAARGAAIKLQGFWPAPTEGGISISGNVVEGSSAYGILVNDGAVGSGLILGNVLRNCAGGEIAVLGDVNYTLRLSIKDNIIRRLTTGKPGIWVDVAATVGNAPRIVIEGNRLNGYDQTAPADPKDNSAIYLRRPDHLFTVKGNYCQGFRYGLSFQNDLPATRDTTTLVVRDNHFADLVVGIFANGASTAATYVAEGNLFESSVGTRILATNKAMYEGAVLGQRVVVYDLNGAPTTGTWAAGDRVEATAPTPGGFVGSVCTAAGSPGTWKSYGAIGA